MGMKSAGDQSVSKGLEASLTQRKKWENNSEGPKQMKAQVLKKHLFLH